MALSEKAKAEELMVIENIALDEAKTKKMAEILKKLNTGKKTLLLVVDKIERNLKIASRNIPDLFITEAKNLNAYEVMWARKVIMTSSAVEQLGKK
jgi:large subunit ribosomal protein L4